MYGAVGNARLRSDYDEGLFGANQMFAKYRRVCARNYRHPQHSCHSGAKVESKLMAEVL